MKRGKIAISICQIGETCSNARLYSIIMLILEINGFIFILGNQCINKATNTFPCDKAKQLFMTEKVKSGK